MSDDWYTAMNTYNNHYDPVAASRAEPSKFDALPTRSYSTVRGTDSSSDYAQINAGGAGISRYRMSSRAGGAESSYRGAARAKHEPTSRDWSPTNSSSGSRKWEPETLNRSKTMTSTRRPMAGYGSSAKLAFKRESVLYSPGVDLSSYAGGYYGGGKTSSIGRSKTVAPSSKRDSGYRDGVDLSSMTGGPSYKPSVVGAKVAMLPTPSLRERAHHAQAAPPDAEVAMVVAMTATTKHDPTTDANAEQAGQL